MAATPLLNVPEASAQAAMYQRYFDEEGLTAETVLNAVDLTYQRADVFLRDALDVFAESGQFESACTAGCGYCCHTLVSVLPHEALHVAHFIENDISVEEREAFKKAVRESYQRFDGMDGFARYTERAACPFLDPKSWDCRLHVARPTVCRAMHSGSLASCKKAYEKRDPTVPTVSMKMFFEYRDSSYAGISTALNARGLHVKPVELNAALVIIWDSKEDAMSRWLAGEDIFADALVSRSTKVTAE